MKKVIVHVPIEFLIEDTGEDIVEVHRVLERISNLLDDQDIMADVLIPLVTDSEIIDSDE